MKILRLYHSIPPKYGGMERHVYFLTFYQNIKKFCSVTLFYNYGDCVSELDVQLLKRIKLFKIKPSAIGVFIFYASALLNLVNNKKYFDVVHIHGDWSSLIFVNLLRRLTNAKVIVFSIHDQLSDSYFHQKILRKLIANVDLIFSTGYDAAKELKALSGKEVVVQPSGISDIFFTKFNKNFNKKIFEVVVVANLTPKKNINLVLDIAKGLKEVRFTVIGAGESKESLESTISKHGISNVQLVGYKNSEAIKKIYHSADCYLLTSFKEGTPTSALEAMACGLPIVSSNAGGINMIVHNHLNGFIVNNFNPVFYIDIIKKIKNNKALRKNIFTNNVLLSSDYMWKNVERNISLEIEKKLNECKD